MENNFCPKCGTKQEGHAFCNNCGNKLSYTEVKKENGGKKKFSYTEIEKALETHAQSWGDKLGFLFMPILGKNKNEGKNKELEKPNIQQETDSEWEREWELLLNYLYGFTKVVIVLIYTFFASWVFYKLVPETLRRSDPLDFIPIAGIKFDLPMSLPYDLVGGLMLIINKVIPIVILLSIVIKFFSKYKFSDIFLWLSIIAISLYTIFVGTSIRF